MKPRVLPTFVGRIAALVTTAVACGGSVVTVGGDSGTAAPILDTIGGTCSSVAPCGGDLLGTWLITSSCAGGLSNTPNAACETLTVPWVTSGGSTITFSADGTYQVNMGFSGTQAVSVPDSCLAAIGITCGGYETMLSAALGQSGGGPSPLVGEASCQEGSGDGSCDCSLVLAGNASGYGNFTTSGTSLTTAPGTGSYCVQGSTLYLSFVPPGTTGSGVVTGNLVAAKR